MRQTFLMMTTALVASQAVAQDDDVALPPVLLDSAFRDERSILDSPVAGTVIEGETLRRKQADTFEELIGDVPGLIIEGGPRPISQELNIRGFQDEQVQLRFDGGRFNFNQTHRGRFFVDPDILQRVEVVRGGGSTLFGSGALGGVVSLETKDASDILQTGETVGGQVKLGYSSNGDVFSANGTVAVDLGRFDAVAFLGTRNFTSDLEDGSGAAIRSSQLDLFNTLLKFGFEPTEEHRLEFAFTYYEDDGTTPPNTNAVSPPDGSVDVDRDAEVQTYRLSWDFNPRGNDFVDLSVLAYANILEITEDRFLDGRADRSTYDTYGLEIVNRSRFQSIDLVYGIEIIEDSQDGFRNGADRTQFPNATNTTFGVFAEATIAMSEQVDLVAGLRYDTYDRNVDDPTLPDKTEDFFSPRIGINYRPTDTWQIYANVARAFRSPTLTELYVDGVHFVAGPGFPLGPGQSFSGVNLFAPTPDLDDEESTQLELGVRYDGDNVLRPGDKLTFSANYYQANVDNFIDTVVTFIDFARPTFGPGGVVFNGSTVNRNVDARIYGIEASINYDAGRWFAGAGLSISRGTARDGTVLGSIPQDRLTGTFGWRATSEWTIGGRATLAVDQSSVPEGQLLGEDYQLLDLYAIWEPQSGPLEGALFQAGIDNVTDENYVIFPNGLPQPGRTFKISATYAF